MIPQTVEELLTDRETDKQMDTTQTAATALVNAKGALDRSQTFCPKNALAEIKRLP